MKLQKVRSEEREKRYHAAGSSTLGTFPAKVPVIVWSMDCDGAVLLKRNVHPHDHSYQLQKITSTCQGRYQL